MSKSVGGRRRRKRAWKGAVKAARAISFIDTGVATKQMAMRIVDQLTGSKSGDGVY
jgi:hypothetical protein